jgi:hypothetical protein
MDMQILFNIAVGIAAFFGGWILNRIYTAIDRLRQIKYCYSRSNMGLGIKQAMRQYLVRMVSKPPFK